MRLWNLPNTSQQDLHTCREIVQRACFVTAVTGAGISVASGLPLLRDDINHVSLRRFFRKAWLEEDPAGYFEVYRTIWQRFRLAQPNPAHRALADRQIAVITQNIDGLHRDAGSERMIELHGNLRELRCSRCGLIVGSERAFLEHVPTCPNCGAMLRPGITLEGEPIRHFARAVDWVGNADVLLVIGTSLAMEPVRRLPDMALRRRRPVIHINREAERWVPWLLACRG